MSFIPRLLRILMMALCFSCILNYSDAQKLRCDQLQALVKDIASDSTMSQLKLTENKGAKYSKEPEYATYMVLFEKSEDSFGDAYISYNRDERHTSYYASYEEQGDVTKQNRDQIKNCLGDDWVLQTVAETDTIYYFRNPSTFVVVKISSDAGTTFIECYNDTRHSAPLCILGNCETGLGVLKYFSGDTYAGPFLDGKLSGFGQLRWAATGQQYFGSFLDGHIAGNGTMKNADGATIATGVFFNGQLVKIDTTQKTCQQGNCETGFGLKVYAGGFYLGNFSMGLYNGAGEMVENNAVYYGTFVNSLHTGKVVFTNAAGDYFFGSYWNGTLQGKYERTMMDKTSLEGYVETSGITMFNADNLFLKSGDWKPPVFTEKTGADYLSIRDFAAAVTDFYKNKSADGYASIVGEMKNTTMAEKLLANMGFPKHKSKKLFMNFDTSVEPYEQSAAVYISVALSKSQPAASWAAVYNKYYALLKKSTGSRWRVVTDDGHAGLKSHENSYSVQNTFDKTMLLKLSFDKASGVTLEIH